MLFAPVAFGLEVGHELEIAASTDVFRDTVLVAPPTVVSVAGLRDMSMRLARRMATADESQRSNDAQQD